MSLHIASDLITEALHSAAAHARSTFLLLDLNCKRRDRKFDASAKILDCKPVEIEQLISVTADGRLLAKSKSRELIASILGVTLESRLSGFEKRVLTAGINGLFSHYWQFSFVGKLDSSRKQAIFSCMRHFSRVRKWTKRRKSTRS